MVAASAALILSSCVKSKLELTYNNQEAKIDSYLMKARIVERDSVRIDIIPNEENPDIYDTVKTVVRWTDTLDIRYNKGAARLIKTEGEGEELDSKGFVSFYYAGYTFSGSVSASNLFVTNHQATAEQAGWNLTDADFGIYEINLGDTRLIPGLSNGLLGVKAGEECEILFSGKHGFGNEEFGIIPANSALLYKIWVVGVAND